MFTKCYIVEVNTSLETIFEDLSEAGFDYSKRMVDDNHMEIYFEVLNIREIQEIMEIMKWYVQHTTLLIQS